MLASSLLDDTIWSLRRAAKRSKAPIWRALEQLRRRRGSRREVNIGRLTGVTKAGETIVVPGKLLGTGSLGHKLTVCSFSLSEAAARKVIAAGGRVITLEDLIKKHPDGRGVRIIG
jgi:large subunit ribosomal protein L18e